jgi:signal transduction histidine kinase
MPRTVHDPAPPADSAFGKGENMTARTWGSVLAAATIAAAGAFGSGLDITTSLAITTAALGSASACHWWRARRRRQRQRDAQLAHTAHELRTPLACVLTALELVRGGYATTPAETSEFLAEAELAARHLAFLVNDVLDEAALASGRLRLQLTDHELGDLLLGGARVLGLHAERRGITLHWQEPPAGVRLCADAHRFLQVLFNLVGNAIKFSPPGQSVRVAWERRGGRIRITVADSGPGVPPAQQAGLFEPFAAGEPADAAPSTGLGLFLAKRLVAAMGGAIGCHGNAGGGACFWFELPAAQRTQAAIAPQAALAR